MAQRAERQQAERAAAPGRDSAQRFMHAAPTEALRAADARFMREALAEARRAADEGEVPIGAVVVCDGEIVARGHNRREADADPSAHAEFSAMERASRKLGRWRLTGCTVYVTLEPCPMCAGLMVNARIDRCVYGAADPKGGALGTLYDLSCDDRLNHAFDVTAGVLAGECAAVLREFFRQRRRGGRGEREAARDARDGGEGATEVSGNACATGPLGRIDHENDQAAAACTHHCDERREPHVPTCVQVASSDGKPTGNHPVAPRDESGATGSGGRGPDNPFPVLPDASSAEPARARSRSHLHGSRNPRSERGAACAERRAPAAPAAVRSARGPAPRVLLAVDSFKGSATSAQAETWLAEGLRTAAPDACIERLPLADGGEGTVDAAHAALGGELRRAPATGPLGAPVDARYLLAGDVAVIEMAAAAGIGLSPRTRAAALAASTRGAGELLLDAVLAGAHAVYLGLGGSATSDGGAGLLQALGARLLDADGQPIGPGLGGLRDLAVIDLAPARRALRGVRIVALSDVRNPLLGPRGTLRVFGPQKGLAFEGRSSGPDRRRAAHDTPTSHDAGEDPAAHSVIPTPSLADCERWLTAYAACLTAARDALDGTPEQVAAPGSRPASIAGVPGAGAAGGLGAALLAVGARLTSGVDALLDLTGFDDAARRADLVITGEGTVDAQTPSGKAPAGVARRAKRANPRARVVAVCGGRADDLQAVYAAGIDLVLPALRRPMPLDRALTEQEARRNLICAGEAAMRAFLL